MKTLWLGAKALSVAAGVLVLGVAVPARSAQPTARNSELVRVIRAGEVLRQGPGLSRPFARSANKLLKSALGGGQLFHYAPLLRGGRVTVFDSRRTAKGFIASSLTATYPTHTSPGTWDTLLIAEHSGPRILDVVRAAKRLPAGRVLEVRYAVGARGQGRGSYTVTGPTGQTHSGNLKQLHAAPLGISVSQVEQLLSSFPGIH